MYTEALNRWAIAKDETIGTNCPACDNTLDQIRWVCDRDSTRIRLTGAINQETYFKALCPDCDHVLLIEQVEQRRIR